MFLHASEAQIIDERCQEILAETALGPEPNVAQVKGAICLICHRLAASEGRHDQVKGLFLLLALILKRSSVVLPVSEFAALKETIFVHSRVIKSSLISNSLSEPVREGKLSPLAVATLLMLR